MTAVAPRRLPGSRPVLLVLALALAALVLTVLNLARGLPPGDWPSIVGDLAATEPQALLIRYGFLPRAAIAWIAGAALGLAGVLFQQVLRNPLAEPATLGISAGAQLALSAATLFAPALLDFGREFVCLFGSGGALLVVLGLAWRRTMSPTTLILAGFVFTFYAGSASALLVVLHHDYLQGVFIWGAGSLVQNGWDQVAYLAPRLTAAFLLALFLVRPLGLLDLGDAGTANLGLSLRATRLVALTIATALSGFTVATVGIVGFVGFAAPALSRLAGARLLKARLLTAPLFGGFLLGLTDQVLQFLSVPDGEPVPTGAVTAVLGAPLLLWLVQRLRPSAAEILQAAAADTVFRAQAPGRVVTMLVFLLPVGAGASLVLGHGSQGWGLPDIVEIPALLHWRLPRIGAAAAAGLMLGLAGTALQRLTVNPMASPEVLGLSSGAATGTILLALLTPEPRRGLQIVAGTAGAALSLLLLLVLGRRTGFAPERMLLAGVALGTAMSALTTGLLASGDPRLAELLGWMAGSTYRTDGPTVALALGLALLFLLVVPACHRWLEILPLGEATALALGVDLRRARLAVLLAAAGLTAAATLIIGPFSFVGLMAPHMARMMGLVRTLPQLLGAAMLGALLLVAADWLGRNLLFPYEIPAGLMSAFIGAPYLLWSLQRR